jgi:hypothetical protein
VTTNEAKTILLAYRPGTPDAEDLQMAEALALAERDPELARWLEAHVARQGALRSRLRQIPVPAGLKEQIISERLAEQRRLAWRPVRALAAVAALVLIFSFAVFWPVRPGPNTLNIYQNRMVGVALRGYAMDLATNDLVQIRAHLARNRAPADFDLPAGLKQVEVSGCAVENWEGGKVSMICFRTGKPLPAGEQSDIWLFVVDSSSFKGLPAGDATRVSRINRLITASWTQGNKLYLLGTEGDEQTLKKYL